MTYYAVSLKINTSYKLVLKKLLIPQLVIQCRGKIQDLWSSVLRFKSGPVHFFIIFYKKKNVFFLFLFFF